jgi:selenocysteine-specific elongation factor
MKSVVVGTAGHIDHGKSALVQALTGIDPDRLKEEKARGITIDLGFAHVAIGAINFAFVDVPGHERFVKNMLAGVGGIDLVVLVVAADESVMPQTREHFDICRLLRVPTGVIALTKADRVDADTLELVRLEVRELAAGSFLAGVPIIAVSSRTGQGLAELRAALAEAGSASKGRSIDGVARLPIDRVFSMKGFGTVVTGTLVSGRLRVDQELLVAPDGRRVKVRGIQVHGASHGEVVAGQRAALNLAGVEVDELARGQTLMVSGTLEQTRLADAVLEVLSDAKPIAHGARVRFHQGTSEILGRVAIIGPLPPAGALQPGSRAYVRLRLESPAVLVRGDRFILRAYSPARTIAGGHVLDPLPPRRTAIRTGSAAERCSRVEALAERGAAVQVGDVLVTRPLLERVRRAILDGLTAHHHSQPLSEGLSREEARVRLFGRGHPAVFDRVLEELIVGRFVVGRDRLALASHHVEWSPDAARAREIIEQTFRDAGLAPPDPASLPSVSSAPPGVVDQVVRLLLRQKVLVKVDTLVFHDETLRRLKQEVGAMKGSVGPDARIDVRTFKERFGVTRKFAIPLLEYLDRERVTRRVGDARLIL